ncbi:MAG: DUF3530 family protein [Gammaproteobacteria bacterium]|nr:DUF3530 family protein [Gammaproteobacteria bacterium]
MPRRRWLRWLSAVFTLGLVTGTGQATEEIELPVGDAVLAARLTASVSEERAGVVMLLPDGLDPRATALADAIAAGLARHGWEVVDIRARILDHAAAFNAPGTLATETGNLVEAVRARTRDRRRPSDIYMVGHGWGAILAGLYLDGRAEPPVAGLAVLNAAPPPGLPHLAFNRLLPGIAVPVFDIWSGRSHGRVTANASARRTAAGSGRGDGFRQLEVAGANHFFTDRVDGVVKRLRGWLKQQSED